MALNLQSTTDTPAQVAAAGNTFDPEGAGYDNVGLDLELAVDREKGLSQPTAPAYPMTGVEAIQPQPSYRPQDTFGEQVWHPDEQSWQLHYGSVSSNWIEIQENLGADLAKQVKKELGDDVYLVLKGRRHKTWQEMVDGEADMTPPRKVVKGPGGRYYSVKK